MNICILTYQRGNKDGGGRFINALRDELLSRGHRVDIPKYSGNFFSFVWAVRKMRSSYDVIYAVDEHQFGLAAYLATLGTKTPYVLTAQGTYAVAPLYNLKTSFLAGLAYRNADAVVAISTFTADMIRKRIPKLDVAVITHGVTMPKEKSEAVEKPYLLSVGALKPRKGYEISLRAFAKAKEKIPELRYIIVGSQSQNPRYVEHVKKIIQELRIEESVDLRTGVSDDELEELYRRASLFILTSVNMGFHFEGFGLVFLEAGAHGIASIGTGGNGIEDAVIDGETGILVPQGDVEATTNAIVTLMQEKDLRRKMGGAAYRHALASTWSLAAEKYEKIFERVI